MRHGAAREHAPTIAAGCIVAVLVAVATRLDCSVAVRAVLMFGHPVLVGHFRLLSRQSHYII